MRRPTAADEERVRRFIGKHFRNVARFGPHEYEVDHEGRRVQVLVKWRRRPGKFTIPDTRLASLQETGGFIVLAVRGREFRLVSAEEAARSGLVKVWRYRRLYERDVASRNTIPVHITLSRDVLEMVDASKNGLTRSKHIDNILRRYFGIGAFEVEFG